MSIVNALHQKAEHLTFETKNHAGKTPEVLYAQGYMAAVEDAAALIDIENSVKHALDKFSTAFSSNVVELNMESYLSDGAEPGVNFDVRWATNCAAECQEK